MAPRARALVVQAAFWFNNAEGAAGAEGMDKSL